MRSAVFVVVGLLLTIPLAPPGEATRPRDITAFGNLDNGVYGLCPDQVPHVVFDLSPASGIARIVVNNCWIFGGSATGTGLDPWVLSADCDDTSGDQQVWECFAWDRLVTGIGPYAGVYYLAVLDVSAGWVSIDRRVPNPDGGEWGIGYASGDVTICRASDLGFGNCPVPAL